MLYIDDEPKLIQELKDNPSTINNNTKKKLIAYVKILHTQGYTKEMIKNKINDLMECNYNMYDSLAWENTIDFYIDRYTKDKYCHIKEPKEILITYKELNKIKQINNINLEKVLFILLIIAKTNNKGGDFWVNNIYTDVFTLAKYRYDSRKGISRENQRYSVLRTLCNLGYLSLSMKATNDSVKLEYATHEHGDGITLTLTNENKKSIVYEYMKWKGDKNIVKCQECNNLFYRKSRRLPKYCNDCREKVHNRTKINKKRKK